MCITYKLFGINLCTVIICTSVYRNDLHCTVGTAIFSAPQTSTMDPAVFMDTGPDSDLMEDPVDSQNQYAHPSCIPLSCMNITRNTGIVKHLIRQPLSQSSKYLLFPATSLNGCTCGPGVACRLHSS